ncbi:MAG: DUF3488 and transglutaminase-like domain-containing protein, partial [Acidimicrobiales bacterium]
TFGLPTPSSLRLLGTGLVHGGATLLSSAVPAPALGPILVVPVALTWTVAWVSVELTLRTRSRLVPLIPPVGGIAVTLLFGGTAAIISISAAMVGLAGAYAALRTAPDGAPARGAPDRTPRPSIRRRVGALAAPVVLVVVTVALAGAAGLPATHLANQFDLRTRRTATADQRDATGPLAQIQARLLQRKPVAMFDVSVDPGSAASMPNWRLVTLDRFDGSEWSSDERFVQAGSTLPPVPAGQAGRDHVVQRVTVHDLDGFWLPAAEQPVKTSLDLVDVGERSRSLALPTDASVADRTYTVESDIGRPSSEQLASADVAQGAEATADTALPDLAGDDRDAIAAAANAAAPAGPSPFDRLSALQAYLRGPAFRLDPRAPSGHSYARVRDFLVTSHAGSSEQFTAAFALMARSLGYPTRLAVGFQRGTSKDGTFTVTSADAYAWPEVAFAGLGWVPFDPTPTTTDRAAPTAALPVPPVPAAATQTSGTASSGQEGDAATSPANGGLSITRVALVVLAVAAVGSVAVLGALAVRRRRRRARARERGTPATRVVAAWHASIETLRVTVRQGLDGFTGTELVRLASGSGGDELGAPLASVATLADLALFGAQPMTEADAEHAWDHADELARQARTRLGRRARLAQSLGINRRSVKQP